MFGISSTGTARALTAALACSVVALGGYSCASAPATREKPQTAAEVAGVAAGAGDVALPALPVAQVTDQGSGTPRIREFDAVDQDLRTALRLLAQRFGLGLEIDPDVHGLVNTRLQNVTLDEALASLLARHSYAYQIQGGVLRVTGSRMQSRNFSLDYVSLSRVASTSTVVTSSIARPAQVQGAGVGVGVGVGVGAGVGGASIQSTTAANLWQDVRIALEALVFYDLVTDTTGRSRVVVDTSQTASSVTAAAVSRGAYPVNAANAVLGYAASAPGATAKTSGDGRRLIINPIAGSIFVTAPPSTLALVESYITSFQASVQRQVLVEAKIVRVSLNKEFRFGINWSLLGSKAKLNFGSGNIASTNTFSVTLGGGSSMVSVALHALESQGDVAVLSSPMITALNNQMAIFDATTGEVFFAVTQTPIFGPNGALISQNTVATPQQVSVGIVLNILAQIGADNVITLQVRPQLSEVSDVREFVSPDGSRITAPVISRRETDTMARVRGGETIVIGGLTQTRRDRTRSGVPGLGRVPGIGGIFGGRSDVEERDELVIFLTPTIIVGAQQTAGR